MDYIIASIAIRYRQQWNLPTGHLDCTKTRLRLVDLRTSHWSSQIGSLGGFGSLRLCLTSYLEIGGQTDELAGSSAEQPARRRFIHTRGFWKFVMRFRHAEDNRQLGVR